mmetsp:Transcript_35654/g.65361  ORF Transcript_35654/g.65361 Transcript_35654/m.65361 type:complete len:96 (-) Transcript_35654:1287-1574(-)
MEQHEDEALSTPRRVAESALVPSSLDAGIELDLLKLLPVPVRDGEDLDANCLTVASPCGVLALRPSPPRLKADGSFPSLRRWPCFLFASLLIGGD